MGRPAALVLATVTAVGLTCVARGGEQGVGAPDTGTITITVNPRDQRQTFTGWGTSLCWWANMVGRWDEAQVAGVVDALVDPERGLGYTVFRYNIGGGDRPGHSHMEERARVQGYKPSADAPYDWSADATQRAVLAAILKRVPDATIEAFSNSPPWWMTNSGCASGGARGASNLRADSYDAFAEYLTDVVKHFRDQFGVRFQSLEPFNEPDVNWWKEKGRQEGCRFDREEQQRLIRIVAAQLRSKGLTDVLLAVADENSIATAERNVKAWDASTLSLVGRINVHSYHGWQARAGLAAFARKAGKPVWQSESGPLSWKTNDRWDNAMRMADVIIKDMRDLRCEAWVDWQVIDGGNWGTLYVDYKKRTWRPSRRFPMHAQFSRFIRPGARIVGTDHPDSLAAVAPDGRSVTVVVLNKGADASRTCRIDLAGFGRTVSHATAYRSSGTEDVAPVRPAPRLTSRMLELQLPPASITTLVVRF